MKAAVLLTVVLVGLAGCGGSEDRARRSADEQAARARHDIDPRSNQAIAAEFVAQRAIERHHEVVQVDGVDTAAAEGVSLTIRFTAHGANSDFWPTDQTEYTFCYELWFHRHHERTPKRVTCPATPAVSYPPLPPEPQMPTPDTLKALLEQAGLDSTAIEQALSKLDLDDSISIDLGTWAGHVGVALRWNNPQTGGYNCVLGRIGPNGAEAWIPARVYLQPGEINCTGEDAAVGSGQRPPH